MEPIVSEIPRNLSFLTKTFCELETSLLTELPLVWCNYGDLMYHFDYWLWPWHNVTVIFRLYKPQSTFSQGWEFLYLFVS